MPDLKSELSKVLNEWNPSDTTTMTQGASKPYFTVTNNVTRITFDYVRDNPGKTRKEVAVALEKQGYKPSSVTSLLGQMVKQGLIRESAHLLYAMTNEYAPLKSSKKVKEMAAKPQEQQRKVVKLVNTRTGEVLNPTPAPQINAAWDAETLLNNLSIKQARALYDELRKIFGG
jgi:DNA-binding MarR family transcriptional regulator